MKEITIENININNKEYNLIINNISNEINKAPETDFIPGVSRRYNENDIPGIKKLYEILIPYIKQNYTNNSEIKILDIKILKHLQGPYKKEGAFIWHHDNHPHNILNIIIYLTDVDDKSGGFQYVSENNQAVKIPFKPPMGGKYHESYVNKMTKNNKFEIKTIEGIKGTAFIFDNCIIHRASIPSNKDRLALILQITDI